MAREIVHVGRKIRVAVETTMTASGAAIRRDIVLHPGAVVILPILDENHVVLLRNHRFAINETLWEVPAGTVEPGEPLQTCAARELAEETGLRARSWRKLLEFYPSPGFCDERMTAYLAEDLTEGKAAPEPYELIRAKWFSWDQALEMVRRGIIRDSKTVTALLYLETFPIRGAGGTRRPVPGLSKG